MMDNSMEVLINSLKLAFKAKSRVMISSLRTRLYHNLGLESNKDDHDSAGTGAFSSKRNISMDCFIPMEMRETVHALRFAKLYSDISCIKTYEDGFLD